MKTLHFDLLGTFSCKEAEADGWRNTTAGRKALSFLQYLVVNHARNISMGELIDQFWADKSDAPDNALKNMVYKCRKFLKAVLPDQQVLIMTLPGCYVWNPEVHLELDSEEFEKACLEARKHPEEEHLELLMDAAARYKGDFLPGNDSTWALSLRRYYQTLYLDICKLTLPLLQKQERWAEMVSICEQASAVDCGTDTFIAYQMQALIAMGQPEQASQLYQSFREMIWREFEIEPSEQVEELHMLAESMRKDARGSQDILRIMAEREEDGRAFLCTFSVFKSIVELEKRHIDRSGTESALAVVSLGSHAAPTTDSRRLERVLLEGLRAGDPVARLDAGSFILMLSGSSEENARMVMSRIDRTFHKVYSHSRARISFRVTGMGPAAEKRCQKN